MRFGLLGNTVGAQKPKQLKGVQRISLVPLWEPEVWSIT